MHLARVQLNCGHHTPSHPRQTAVTRFNAAPRISTQLPGSYSKQLQHRNMSTSATKTDRARGAVVGALVADAATMGLHWIYDQGKLYELLKSKGKEGNPEFFDPPSCPFYQVPSGTLSPYGAELAALLKYLSAPEQKQQVTAHAALDGASWAKSLAAYFTDVYQGYKNKSIKSLIANIDAGKSYPETGDSQDTQANSLCKVPLITAVYAGTAELPAAVEASVRAQQNNDTSVALGLAAARILEKVVLGSSIEQAITWAQQDGNLPASAVDSIKQAMAVKGEPFNSASQKLGVSCAMPGAFQNTLVVASTAKSYSEGIRINMVAGGDNCSRSVYLGALLGAAYGVDAVPAGWKSKVTGWSEMEAAVNEVVA